MAAIPDVNFSTKKISVTVSNNLTNHDSKIKIIMSPGKVFEKDKRSVPIRHRAAGGGKLKKYYLIVPVLLYGC